MEKCRNICNFVSRAYLTCWEGFDLKSLRCTAFIITVELYQSEHTTRLDGHLFECWCQSLAGSTPVCVGVGNVVSVEKEDEWVRKLFDTSKVEGGQKNQK